MARKPQRNGPLEPASDSLDHGEHKDAARRAPPRAAVVFETVRSEGQQELERPIGSLAWSGLAAGLSMGFSFLGQALLATYLPDAQWTHVISDLGYSVGFLIVILGRQQLFTENTLTPVTVLLRQPNLKCLGAVLRLWGVVLATNTIGALVFALLISKTAVLTPEMHRVFADLSVGVFRTGFSATLLRGVLAGWLIATLIWLMPVAQMGRVSVIIIITYVIALGQFSHIIAGSVDAFYAVLTGHGSWVAFFGRFYIPTLIGNIVGGVLLVAVINYAQVDFIRKEHEGED